MRRCAVADRFLANRQLRSQLQFVGSLLLDARKMRSAPKGSPTPSQPQRRGHPPPVSAASSCELGLSDEAAFTERMLTA